MRKYNACRLAEYSFGIFNYRVYVRGFFVRGATCVRALQPFQDRYQLL